MVLEGLGEKEQAGCMMEASVLKNLNHPNIVGYKESFLGNNNLTIIMDYCEGKYLLLLTWLLISIVGDLAYHIKKKAGKNEQFSE